MSLTFVSYIMYTNWKNISADVTAEIVDAQIY